MKILLVGGGSGGPVSPLLAVAEEIKTASPKTEFLFVGTKNGPEKNMASRCGIPFVYISAGKLRRYFSLLNLVAPIQVLVGFFQSISVLRKFKPDCIFGTGSFVQVPLVWTAKIMGIPTVLHQQDIIPSLANKLCEHAAKKITVSFADSLTDFSSGLGLFYGANKEKILLTGNPFRSELKEPSKEDGLKYFNLKKDKPVLLVLGGGTGAVFINRIVAESLSELTKIVQVVHSTGANKKISANKCDYLAFEFIERMDLAYAAADIVISRAGLSTITELSNLSKISIIIPMPDSHQEYNAYVLKTLGAALVFDQSKLSAVQLTRILRKLLFDHGLQQSLKANISKIMPKDSAAKIAKIIIKISEKNKN